MHLLVYELLTVKKEIFDPDFKNPLKTDFSPTSH